jgi:hypothetical protein
MENSNLVSKNGITSGAVRNCYVRINTADEAPALEIFFPKSEDNDRWEIRFLFDEPYIARRQWIDSGLRIFLKDIPSQKIPETVEPLIEKITTHFSKKYPHDVFKRCKNYSSGRQSRVILLHINEHIVLKYCEELRTDFTKNYMKVIVNEAGALEKVYINTYELGTLEYKNGRIEMHRWENENEAQSGSFLSRHYPQRLLNGVVDEPAAKADMIGIIKSSMNGASIEPEEKLIFEKALVFLEQSLPAGQA